MNDMIRSRFPQGTSFNFDPEGQFSKIIDTAETIILPEIIATANSAGTIRNPWLCLDYNALALDFGAQLYKSGDLDRYREYLAGAINKIVRTGSDTDIQTVLIESGFVGTTITTNHNLNDLRSLTYMTPTMVAGNATASCGNNLAFCGSVGYEVIANGKAIDRIGNNLGYPIPYNPEEWGYIIVVSGGVTKDVDGNITAVTELDISAEYYDLFVTLLLRTKPLHAICIMVVNKVSSNVIAQTGDPEIPTIAQTGSTTIPIIAQGF